MWPQRMGKESPLCENFIILTKKWAAVGEKIGSLLFCASLREKVSENTQKNTVIMYMLKLFGLLQMVLERPFSTIRTLAR